MRGVPFAGEALGFGDLFGCHQVCKTAAPQDVAERHADRLFLTLDWTPECILLVEMSDKRYRIGELATLTGLTPDALRFYERQGVLDKPARTSGRFSYLLASGC